MGEGERKRTVKTTLIVLLVVGIAVISVGSVAALGRFDTSSEQAPTIANKIDTEAKAISVASTWMVETGRYSLIEDTAVVKATYLDGSDYGEAWLVSFCRDYASTCPKNTTGVNCTIVKVGLKDGIFADCILQSLAPTSVK